MDAHRQAYREEAYELLTELESSLLELEENPEDMDLIGRVFRAMHTIKGSGAMFGFEDIATFTHEVETVFDKVRNGQMTVTRELVNLTLRARDLIKGMLDASEGGEPVEGREAEEVIAGLRALVPAPEVRDPLPMESVHAPLDTEGKGDAAVTYRIRFIPTPEITVNGTNPLLLLAELRQLGSCRVVAQMERVPALEECNPEFCYVYWDVILTSRRGIDAIRDVFIFIEDDCELKIDTIDDGGILDVDSDYKKLGIILAERGDLTRQDMEAILARQKRFGELLVEQGILQPEKVESALIEQQHVKEVRKERQAQESASSIRVPAEKLDILVNLVGELVTVQARLSQTAAGRDDALLVTIAEEVERLTNELRDTALNIRMLPIGTTFSKFKRLVRDLSVELGKDIELTTAGAETELDKTVIERLNDPLVHLIRNSIDHGIEMPEAREAAGKPRQGTVHLAAVHSGDSVLITITDDGAGLDKEAIRAKGVDRGLVTTSAELTDKEIYNLIFAPGFSTAKKVTSVSGRGVGMDVVKKAIDALRGTIDIASERGKGSTITIKLPLTLAIIESLLVKIGTDCFVMPLSIVEECIELTREDVANAHGRNLANVRDQIIPYIPLRERFRIQGEPPEIEQIVITTIQGSRIGFVVDDVIGEHQTVIKSLGKMYKDVKGLSGATILGDGSVALILDVPHLVREVEREQVAR
ncbi:chemotaxis protein CheA [Geobacter sulfurreducens subsp. ethanolicus]|uniref:chemotaxis protein CheA n=1 Tax=Geobacter sulfurreducens TaxID=35554 RepID=UPI0025735589|nr:chemotaxis protein CheA [Geobacter sulfurreducens]BEH10721.1 chemotaxis protein CheA [Geobacter sulfurreducens subsp. ethanolicus]